MYENNDMNVTEDTIENSGPIRVDNNTNTATASAVAANAGTAKGKKAKDADTDRSDGFGRIFKEPGRLVLFIFTIILSLALIIGGVLINIGIGGSKYKIDVAGTLSTGTYNYVDISTENEYYQFTPGYSGYYTFYSTNSDGLDTYGTLYNSSLETLTYNDDGGSARNFNLSYYLTGGDTYFLAVRTLSGSGWVRLYVESGY